MNDAIDTVKNSITANIAANNLPSLTHQEAHFLSAISTGISLSVAATRSGISASTARKWVELPHIKVHMEKLAEERAELLSQTVKYSLEDAHMDIEQGKAMAANATEWFRGVEMHMKLHGLGQEKKGPSVSININNVHSSKQLEELDDSALLELAGDDYHRLQPEDMPANG